MIRPLSVLVGLAGSGVDKRQQALISWLGIRGIGSFYYLMHVVGQGLSESFSRQLVSLVVLTIAVVGTLVDQTGWPPLVVLFGVVALAGVRLGRPDVGVAHVGQRRELLSMGVERTRERVAEILGADAARERVRVGAMDDLSCFPESSFDLVVALGIYHNARSVDEWERSVAETARVLRSGGRLLVNVDARSFLARGNGDGRSLRERDRRRSFSRPGRTSSMGLSTSGLARIHSRTCAAGGR